MPFNFDAISTPFRMQPGLRRLASGAHQLTPTRPGEPVLLEKLAVLTSHPDQALLISPGFDPYPATRALFDHAAAEHPDAWRCESDGTVRALHLGWAVKDGVPLPNDSDALIEIGHCLAALTPDWRSTALWCLAFAEDLAVIDGSNAHIPWLAVCLPSHWAPERKIGRHFAEVHAPVADNQLLIAASDHLARLVTGRDRWERWVWNITSHPHLDAHPTRHVPQGWPADAEAGSLAALAFLRTERQTFIPLADHRQAVFTIHVESQPLVAAINDPAHAQCLHDALHSMSAAVLAYRGLTDARDRLLSWLSARGAGDIG
ncbi:MAG: hypothetical protein CFE40_05930 [Burkholderiales bacterium PBB1]|nr:MAG: hypothetical protein CFE40_05930 [Burkholderiales bacterium PBB1]